MKKLIIVDENELDELVKRAVIEHSENQVKEADFHERLTRKDAAIFLGISYQALGQWTRKGWIKQHGAGRKGYYLKGELMNIRQKNPE